MARNNGVMEDVIGDVGSILCEYLAIDIFDISYGSLANCQTDQTDAEK